MKGGGGTVSEADVPRRKDHGSSKEEACGEVGEGLEAVELGGGEADEAVAGANET